MVHIAEVLLGVQCYRPGSGEVHFYTDPPQSPSFNTACDKGSQRDWYTGYKSLGAEQQELPLPLPPPPAEGEYLLVPPPPQYMHLKMFVTEQRYLDMSLFRSSKQTPMCEQIAMMSFITGNVCSILLPLLGVNQS
ncbi:UNVERIFIED_CONTAM: hypothetical protein FKN15_043092 [Acipenser sinensis]